MTFSEWRRRRRIVKSLKESMYGMTLNSIGPLYGCNRRPGESNRDFEKRIYQAVMTVDKTWVLTGGEIQVDIEEGKENERIDTDR